MKRISVVLKASEVTAVRKAVCSAGGSRVVITPMAHRACVTELSDWYCGAPATEHGDHARLDVMVDDQGADAIVGAILATAHAGKIEQITRMPAKEMRVSPCFAKRAA
jgi:nitrogen regulatory protein PII